MLEELVDNSDLTTINSSNNTCAVDMARLVSYKVKDDSTYFTFENKSASVTDRLMTTEGKNSNNVKRSGCPYEWGCCLWRCCSCCKCISEENEHKNIETEIPLVRNQQDQVKFLRLKFLENTYCVYFTTCHRSDFSQFLLQKK